MPRLRAAEAEGGQAQCVCAPVERAGEPELRVYTGCDPLAERCRWDD